jgi:hypothetical protein
MLAFLEMGEAMHLLIGKTILREPRRGHSNPSITNQIMQPSQLFPRRPPFTPLPHLRNPFLIRRSLQLLKHLLSERFNSLQVPEIDDLVFDFTRGEFGGAGTVLLDLCVDAVCGALCVVLGCSDDDDPCSGCRQSGGYRCADARGAT